MFIVILFMGGQAHITKKNVDNESKIKYAHIIELIQ